ncbi:hypothetical protein OS493_023218 [Desmophyllum pertusum]|uniref:Endonuclease/exonuclease/phosphatase domain-containing protein n=1 Tax=Desmophyllum pertusum TaxID=174260 RepID=A0A9W9YM35_9CNID|nr:hypothetical protein OS493_023218 [Desmophyllum pertusum]
MDDPTIFEDCSRQLLQYVEEQVEAGRDPDSITDEERREFKKCFQDTRLKSASWPSYFIMTINMNGPAIKGSGIAKKRRTLVSILMRSFFSDIIFCQELPGKFETEVVDKCGAFGYQYVQNEKESAVLWRTEDFDGSTEGLKTTDRRMIQLRNEVEGASEVLSRIAMVKLTSRKSSDTVLAVSYHGCYKAGDEEKKRQFQGLNTFLCKVIKEKGINSYIIGGDFNLNTLDVELPKDVAVPNYELSPRQSRKAEASSGRYIPYKDNFVYYPVQWCPAISSNHRFHYNSELAKLANQLALFFEVISLILGGLSGNWASTVYDRKIRVAWTRPFQFEDNASAASDLTKEDHAEVQDEMKMGTISPPKRDRHVGPRSHCWCS